MPRLPMPMPPSVIRSLGATCPSRPNAELGMGIAPNADAAKPAPTEVRKNPRRDKRSDRLLFMPSTLRGLMKREAKDAPASSYKTLISQGFSRRK